MSRVPSAPSSPAAPPPSRSARTRERILKVSLDLFNAQGEANVTTGHIADELNISPGNLYYHFRNKDEIIQHLFADFEKAIDVGPGEIGDAAHVMEDMWLYLHLMFERIWQYRFLYRNLDDLVMRDAKLRSHFNIIVGHKREAVKQLCDALVGVNAMRANEDEIRALADNILVVATYWLNFEHLRAKPVGKFSREEPDAEQHLSRGVYQVMSLVKPFLLGEAREHLQHLMDNYSE
ncbi:MAG: TetR/AcrR family transcriptional regulator [Betaproteobacteria bacterium]|nr:TetR/AcrR family transcriptional regulator [Betaproteobacteria bacterium]